ncbi:MAG: hypothetical protein ACI9LY_000993 [Arenicella sp.]|jgi:hypothetical protein
MDSKRIVILVLITALLAAAINAFISSRLQRDASGKSNSQTQILGRLELLQSSLVREHEARQAFPQEEMFLDIRSLFKHYRLVRIIFL